MRVIVCPLWVYPKHTESGSQEARRPGSGRRLAAGPPPLSKRPPGDIDGGGRAGVKRSSREHTKRRISEQLNILVLTKVFIGCNMNTSKQT